MPPSLSHESGQSPIPSTFQRRYQHFQRDRLTMLFPHRATCLFSTLDFPAGASILPAPGGTPCHVVGEAALQETTLPCFSKVFHILSIRSTLSTSEAGKQCSELDPMVSDAFNWILRAPHQLFTTSPHRKFVLLS